MVVFFFIGCFIMGMFVNLFFVLVLGMGINVYFVYMVVGFYGFGNILYWIVLVVVLVEGVVFLLFVMFGLSMSIVKLMLKLVCVLIFVGIGFFLVFIGF